MNFYYYMHNNKNYLDDLNNIKLVKKCFKLFNNEISQLKSNFENNLDDSTLSSDSKLDITKLYTEIFISNIYSLFINLKENSPLFKLYIQEKLVSNDLTGNDLTGNDLTENQITSSSCESAVVGGFGACTSFNGDGTRLAVGAPNYSNNISNSGLIRIYDYSSSNGWQQIGNDIEGGEDDKYGLALKLSYDGTTLIIGSSKDDRQGYARVYKYDSTADTWNKKGNDILGTPNYSTNLQVWDNFGHSVAINFDGSIIAIGAPKYESPPGMEYDGSTWYELGCVFIYDYDNSNNTWENNVSYTHTFSTFPPKDPITNNIIVPRRIYSNMHTGATIDMNYDGTIVAASTPGYYKSGGVIVVKNDGVNNWSLITKDMGITMMENYQLNFGCSISLNKNGDMIAIGANYVKTRFTDTEYGEDATYKGVLSLWQYNTGTTWNELPAEYQSIYGGINDEFGYSVSLNSDAGNSGSRIIVAASALTTVTNPTNYNVPSHRTYDSTISNTNGTVRVYEYDPNSNSFNQLGTDIDGVTGDQLGYDGVGTGHNSAVSLNNDGSLLAIGAIGNNLVRTYEYDLSGNDGFNNLDNINVSCDLVDIGDDLINLINDLHIPNPSNVYDNSSSNLCNINNDEDLNNYKYNIGSGTCTGTDYDEGNLPILIPYAFKSKFEYLNLYLPGIIFLYNPENSELSVKISYIDSSKETNIKSKSSINFIDLPQSEIITKVFRIVPNLIKIDLSLENHVNFINEMTRLNYELFNFGLFISKYITKLDLKYKYLKRLLQCS